MTEFKPGEVALFKTWSGDKKPVRVTIIEKQCHLNWRVRFDEDCNMGSRAFVVGTTYTAGISQLLKLNPPPPPPPEYVRKMG